MTIFASLAISHNVTLTLPYTTKTPLFGIKLTGMCLFILITFLLIKNAQYHENNDEILIIMGMFSALKLLCAILQNGCLQLSVKQITETIVQFLLQT